MESPRVIDFFTQQLGPADYFGGARLSLADITAGAAVPLIQRLGVDLQGHPAIAAWQTRLAAQAAWRQTDPDDAAFNTWKHWVSLRVKRRQRQLART
ncbi:MAG: glutathione binding-like protein [Cyanobacteria bacterium P01_F01_bin.4]